MIQLSPPESQFIVFSLPRSRSAWMAHFLRYGGSTCGHDIATSCSSVAEFKEKFYLLAGTCETGAVLGWRVLREEFPKAKFVVVKRDPMEVWSSLLSFGIEADLDDLVRKWVLLDVVSALPGTLTLDYDSLRHPEPCKQLFELCLDLPFDWLWWQTLSETNIQVNMGQRLQQLALNYPKIQHLKAEIAGRTAALGEHHSCLN